jgi:hypothetical protein
MKKILSIILTVTMIFSLVAAFRAPTAEAFPGTTVVLTTSSFSPSSLYRNSQLSRCSEPPSNSNPYWILNKFSVFSTNPYVGSPGAITTLNDCSLGSAGMHYEEYHMGEYIYGYVTGHTFAGTFWTIALAKLDATSATGYRVIDAQHQAVGTPRFSMATANAEYDGEYFLVFADGVDYFPGDPIDPIAGSGVFDREAVWITYNLTLNPVTINTCASSVTITGWLTRAPGSTITQRVQIAITYPDLSMAGNYDIIAGSSGYFTITFPINHLDPNYPDKYIGRYYIFVRFEDPVNYIGWPNSLSLGEPDNYGRIIYSYIDNTPVITMNLSTYISPIRIYKDQNWQPILLHLVDQDGNPVTGLKISDWTYSGFTISGVAGYFSWVATTNYALGNVVIPTAGFSGHYYEVTNDLGSSGAVEPVWPTMDGATVVDGGLTWTAHQTYKEISPGFYRFVINVPSTSVDVRLRATWNPYGTPVLSNQVIINTIDKTVFNPYVDVTAPDAIAPYGEGPWILDSVESVYDKLPCTIGNSFNIMVDSWDMPTEMLDNWYVYDGSWEINGPVELMWEESGDGDDCTFALGDEWKVLITQKGKISVTVNMTAWERVNKTDCPDWNPRLSETDMSQNACCHTYTKTFDICEVNSCTYGGVTLSGANITDSTTVEVGKKVDKLSVSVDPTGAPTDLVCSCPNYIVLMYMTKYIDGRYRLLANAFTVDTWSGTSYKGSMIWYNPQGATGPNIPDQPIQTFMPTGLYNSSGALVTNGLKFGDCPFNLYGITFNYPTDTPCYYQLVVKVIGLNRSFDACGNMVVTYPMIAEDLYPITVTPSVTTLTATHTITEGTVDPDQMLAGVPAIIDITAPGFSVDGGDTDWYSVSWKFYFNGTLLNSYSYCPTGVEVGLTVNYSTTDTGYRFVLSRPFKTSGTFKIVGTSYYYDCTKKEVVTIEIEVLKPEFTVKIGLKDCDGTIIDNDGILTEGFDEIVYVTAVDPRGLHDFSTDPDWSLSVSAVLSDCDLPTSKVCGVVEGPGCSYGLPIRVVGYDNPNLADDPMVNLYFNSNIANVNANAKIKITSFTLVPPTVKVDPKEVPFTIPATATHLTFTVTDAHGHGASGVNVVVLNTGAFGVGASGYSWSATAGTTGCKGEVDWAFVPPYSGKYSVRATTSTLITCALPCGWPGINTNATIQAVYQAPVVDTTKPVVDASAPATVTSPMVTVTGKVTDNVGIVSLWIGAMKVDFAPDGTFKAVVEVVVGANTIKVVAFDAAGNMGDKTLTVTYAVPKVTVVKVQIGSDIMTVNGNAVQIDAPAEIKNGRTFLPLRAISEALGATVDWIAETQGITVTLGDNSIGLQIGNTSAVVNGTVMTLDAAPYIKNNRTMVPFRVIAEGLGATVEWDPALRIVTVTLAQ